MQVPRASSSRTEEAAPWRQGWVYGFCNFACKSKTQQTVFSRTYSGKQKIHLTPNSFLKVQGRSQGEPGNVREATGIELVAKFKYLIKEELGDR